MSIDFSAKAKHYLWVEGSCISNVTLQCFCTELWIDSFVLEAVYVDYMFGDVQIRFFIALVENDKEQIKTTHDRRTHCDIRPQGLLPVVSSSYWIGGRQN